MRTTIELKPEHRARLLDLAARRGEKGFSGVVCDALDAYFTNLGEQEERRSRALRLRGSLSGKEAERLRRDASRLRASWR